MVRATEALKVIEEEGLVRHAERMGVLLLLGLGTFADEFAETVSNVRGRGLIIAFDLPSGEARDEFKRECFDEGLLVLGCGERSIRLRPALNVSAEEIEDALDIMRRSLGRLPGAGSRPSPAATV